MDCLNRNNYDRDACLDYFQAYRDCKNSWVHFSDLYPAAERADELFLRSSKERMIVVLGGQQLDRVPQNMHICSEGSNHC